MHKIQNLTNKNVNSTGTTRKINYVLYFQKEYETYEFSDDEKRVLRPIAETLAMLHGNAFFTMQLGDGREWYEQYLPEAMSLFMSNGGSIGWASQLSWIRDFDHETPEVAEAYENYRILKSLSRGTVDKT